MTKKRKVRRMVGGTHCQETFSQGDIRVTSVLSPGLQREVTRIGWTLGTLSGPGFSLASEFHFITFRTRKEDTSGRHESLYGIIKRSLPSHQVVFQAKEETNRVLMNISLYSRNKGRASPPPPGS